MRRSQRFLSTLLAAVVAFLLALTLGVVPTASALGTATITGTVTAPGGAALPSVDVTAFQWDAVNGYWDSVQYASTDGSGDYALTGLSAGTYHIGFYDYSGNYVGEYFDNAATVDAGTDVVVADGATVAGKNAALAPAAHITGTVTGAGGAPLDNRDVTAYQWDAANGYWDSVSYSGTDATGAYDLGGLAAGTYRVGFDDYYTGANYISEYYDDAATLEAATDISVTAGGTTAGKDAQLSLAGHIAGTVTGVAAAALSDVDVTAYQWDTVNGYWDYVSDVYTGVDGGYDLGGLPTGTYRLGFFDQSGAGYISEYFDNAASVTAATDVSVTAGGTTSGKDAQLAPGGHITGTVTGVGGAGLSSVEVTAYQWDAVNGYWDYVSYGITGVGGGYDLGRLPTGTYRIGFYDYTSTGYATEYYDNAATVSAATDISVIANATTSGKNAQLAPGGHITGTVTGAGGTPLSDVDITAYQWDGATGSWNDVGYSYTGADGTYDMRRLPAGTYRIGFEDYYSGAGYLPEFYDNVTTVGAATDVSVASGATTSGKNAQLSSTPPTPTPIPAPIPAPIPTVSPLAAITAILADVHVAGKLKVGKTLKLTNLVASYRGTVGYKIQWYAGKKAIKKATKPKLKLTSTMRGKAVSVKVKALSGGVSKTRKIKVGKVK